jgi:hypothetical protein
LANPGVAVGVAIQAAHRHAVFACTGLATEPAPASTATGIDRTAMDRPERRCRERREHERVRGYVSRDTFLFVPGESSRDEEVGVPAVAL